MTGAIVAAVAWLVFCWMVGAMAGPLLAALVTWLIGRVDRLVTRIERTDSDALGRGLFIMAALAMLGVTMLFSAA